MTLPTPPRRTPATARNDDAGNRLYTWTGRGVIEEFYSVTTMLRVVPKHLLPWTAKVIAELVYDDVLRHGAGTLDHWAELGRAYIDQQRASGMKLKGADESPRGLSLRYLKGEPDRIRDTARDRGTDTHTASEEFILGNVREGLRFYVADESLPEFDPVIAPYMAGMVAWLRAFRPRIVATEFTVFHRAESYAGTGDLIVEVLIDGKWLRLLVDLKTGKAVYPEVAMQCEAYSRGEFIGGADLVTEFPLPALDGTAVLLLNPTLPNGYSFRRLRHDDVVWRSFLYTREMFRWSIETSKSVLLEEIAPDLADALEQSVKGVA